MNRFPQNAPAAGVSASRRGARAGLRTGRIMAAAVVALPLGAAGGQSPSTGATLRLAEQRGSAPAAAPAVRFGDARLATGVRLRYAEQGDPAGEPVILLHGYSDSWFSYSGVLPLLPARYHVFALDQRGHGDSDRPAGGYAMRDLAADVIAFMDAKQLARATVVGHSMGSFVAQQVALAAPGRVSRLVLMGSATSIRAMPGVHELQAAVESFDDEVSPEFAREFQVSTVYGPLPAGFMDRAVEESLKLPVSVWKGIMAGMLASGAPVGLRDSRIPTLVVWGDKDAVFPSRAEQDTLVALLGSAATLKVYAETGHALHWERPAAFVRDLEAFLKTP